MEVNAFNRVVRNCVFVVQIRIVNRVTFATRVNYEPLEHAHLKIQNQRPVQQALNVDTPEEVQSFAFLNLLKMRVIPVVEYYVARQA